jgi:hypothetical protein
MISRHRAEARENWIPSAGVSLLELDRISLELFHSSFHLSLHLQRGILFGPSDIF